MRLKKAPVYWSAFFAIVATGGMSFYYKQWDIVMACLSSMIALVGIGIAGNVGEAAQRSAFYRPELDKKEKEQ